jgi:lipid-binding SYLF domain-containing protein
MSTTRRSTIAAALALAGLLGFTAPAAHAASSQDLAAAGHRALEQLYAEEPDARLYARHARAILVFPTIIKGAFVFGGETGDGVLLSRDGQPQGYYNISAASWGLQAGGKSFSYALFLMNDRAIGYLHDSAGWAIGAGGNIVVIDKSAAAVTNSTTLTQDVYAFPFAGKGLMAGIDIHGSKITQIHPD